MTSTATGIDSDVPILKTKLYRPTSPKVLVRRKELLQRLEAGKVLPLTLVSAPAGYGKSQLISSWLEHCEWPFAWFSLDADDADLTQFLTYLVAAVRDVAPGACETTLSMTTAMQMPPVSRLAAALVNELDAFDHPLILVLDDYHQISVESPVNTLLSLLSSRPPLNLHLVIITRRDPPLPMAAMRANGQVNEIGASELRFKPTEVRELLGEAVGLNVSDETLDNLERELEGWVAGLQMVSLAARGRENPDRFLGDLSGGILHMHEYLIQEVIARQPPQLLERLLQCALLDRFCGPLCDALRADENAGAQSDYPGDHFTRSLCEGNLFTIPLDTRGEWFRFHHLFQDLLRSELEKRMRPEQIGAIHSRASQWFESQDFIAESIKHALKAGETTRAAEIVEGHRDDEFLADRWTNVDRWMAMLPAELRRGRPRLLLTEAWIGNMRHQFPRVSASLERVEPMLIGQPAESTLVGELDFFLGYVAYFEGHADQSRQYLEEAVSILSGRRTPFLAEAQLMLGLARCMTGQQGMAIQTLQHLINEVDQSEAYLGSRFLAGLIFIHMVCGDLYQARIENQRLHLIAKRHGFRMTEAWSYYMWGWSHLHSGELTSGAGYFAQTVELRYVLEPRAAVDALAGLALSQQLLGQDEAAAETTVLLQAYARELNESNYLEVARSCRARLAVLRGDLEPALEWALSTNVEPQVSELFLWMEAPAITRARVLVVAGREADLIKGAELLRTIREQTEAAGFTCQSIEVAVLHSLLLDRQGKTENALQSLRETIAAATPGRWVRPFVELGAPMAALLERLAQQAGMTGHMRRILDRFGERQTQPQDAVADQTRSSTRKPRWSGEPLTNRELDILELVARRLQNKEIAGRLFVSPETVKTHLKHLYQKLGVSNRREAAAKAGEILAAMPSEAHTLERAGPD